jgi:hypothetical protein
MSEDNIIKKWLDTMIQKNVEYKRKKEQQLQSFLKFTQKTPQQIIHENKTLGKKEFKNIYSNNFNSFIGHMKSQKVDIKELRGTTDAIQDFFKFANLPLSLGVRGHINLFLG